MAKSDTPPIVIKIAINLMAEKQPQQLEGLSDYGPQGVTDNVVSRASDPSQGQVIDGTYYQNDPNSNVAQRALFRKRMRDFYSDREQSLARKYARGF